MPYHRYHHIVHQQVLAAVCDQVCGCGRLRRQTLFGLLWLQHFGKEQPFLRQIMVLWNDNFPATKALIAGVVEADLEEDFNFQPEIFLISIEALIVHEMSV